MERRPQILRGHEVGEIVAMATGKAFHHNDGLRKRCTCGHRHWAKCPHAWHVNYSIDGREFRACLHRYAGKPTSYVMGRTEAEALRDKWRYELRKRLTEGDVAGAGPSIAGERPSSAARGPARRSPLTFGQLADDYLKQHVRIPTRRPLGRKLMEWHVGALRRAPVERAGCRLTLEEITVAQVTKADLETLRRYWRTRLPRDKGGEVGANRVLSRLRHIFNWAIAEGYVEQTPFKRNGVTVFRLTASAETPRHRRLDPGEEEGLLGAASPWLRDLVTAALETGCRRGELLSLQWSQVRWQENTLLLPADKTKTGEARAVPMTARLKEVLNGRRHDRDGQEYPGTSYVFGNEVGERRMVISQDWKAAVDAADITGLHFHDLRREFGSRLLETPGVALHDVREWLGHSNVMTTSRYLSTTPTRRRLTLERFEQGRRDSAPA